MIVVISPSKTLDYSSKIDKNSYTIPDFMAESSQLIGFLRKKKPTELSALMDVSEKIAKLNVKRYHDFNPPFDLKNARQAIFAFKGDVYKGIEVDSYNKDDIQFAQKHLRIISGLYGLLRPLDLIQPYRLEMGIALKTPKAKDLYEFWGDKITQKINSQMLEQKTSLLVNLASNEYFKAVKKNKLNGELLNVVFKEKQGKDFKIIGIFAKQARGKMANYIIKNRLTSANDIMNFSDGGYKFNRKLSDEQNYIFTRSKI